MMTKKIDRRTAIHIGAGAAFAATSGLLSLATPVEAAASISISPYTLQCVHRGGSDDQTMWWATSIPGIGASWTADTQFTNGNQCSYTPALAVLNGKLYCVHRGGDDTYLHWTTFNPASLTWTPDQLLTNYHFSVHGPALAVFNNTLYCVHRGDTNDQNMYWTTFDPPSGYWGVAQLFGILASSNQCSWSPALAVLNGTLYCVHRGGDDTNLWWTTFDPPSGYWTPDTQFTSSNQSIHGPALAVFNNTLYCVHRGGAGDQNMYWTTFDPTSQTWTADTQFTNGNQCSYEPALAVLNDFLYCVHRGGNDTNLWWTIFNPVSQTWAEDTQFTNGNQSVHGPALAPFTLPRSA